MRPIALITRGRRLLLIGWAVFVTTACLVVLAVSDLPDLEFQLLAIPFTVVATLLAIRQPSNRISTLFFMVGAATLATSLVQLILVSPPSEVTASTMVALFFAQTSWIFIFGTLFHVPYLFPDGQLPTARWRWVYWVDVGLLAVLVPLALFSEKLEVPEQSWTVINPIGFIPPDISTAGFVVIIAGLFTLIVGGVAAMVVRWKRASDVIRTQIKWVIYASALFLAGWVGQFMLVEEGGEDPWWLGAVFVLGTAAIPISVTIAVIRYRLFDIDRLISRTLGYALVTGILVSFYLGAALFLPTLFTSQQTPPIFVAGATLAVAALFNPVRKRVLSSVDRRFYRSRHDAQRVAEALSARLNTKSRVDEITEMWIETTHLALQPSSIAAWIAQPDSGSKP